MRAVVQRVIQASVAVNGEIVGAINEPGLLVLVGVTHDDTPRQAAKLAAKLWGLRILDGEKSCSDVAAPLLVISQFTLYADLAKGRRPSWTAAAPGPVAEPLVDAVVQDLRDLGARVETGVFGAEMKVSLVNDGPVTIIIDLLRSPPRVLAPHAPRTRLRQRTHRPAGAPEEPKLALALRAAGRLGRHRSGLSRRSAGARPQGPAAPEGVAKAAGPSPASTHCGRACSEI